jgi:U3 small nucleolar RNA-associated protein 14
MRRNARVTVNTRRGPGLVGTMGRTAVIAGTATAVSTKTNQAMTQSAQAKQSAQQAHVQTLVDQQVAEQMAQQQALAEQQALQQQLADQQAQLQALLQQQAAPPVPAAPAADPNAAAMRITKLQELAALRDAGILTEAEFEVEKARILAG